MTIQNIDKFSVNDLGDAELFLMRLYESKDFRDSVSGLSSRAEFEKLLDSSGFNFDTYQLARVLAEFVIREIE